MTHEIDVVGLAAGEHSQNRSSRILVIGEAKSSDRKRTPEDLRRLERMRALLEADGADCCRARLLLFGRSGFTDALRSVARRREDVGLVDLARIYQGE